MTMLDPMTDPLLTLTDGTLEAVVAPACGGGLAALRFEGADVMRPADAAALAARDPLGLACFPLVPWSNRIALGRFAFGGREILLPPNMGDHPHAIHGHGWRCPWQVVAADAHTAALVFDHALGRWPWRYRATQRLTVADGVLTIELAVENRAETPMPAGLGLHPYFPRTPGMTLHARLDGWWETDALVMPVALHEVEPRADWSGWLHRAETTDNVFTGWDGRARLVWPERGLALDMTCSDAAGWMVVYAPTDAPIACIEGVTHPTDALNDPALPGVRILAPGETFALTTRFRPARLV
jgi:aldose 1-epimerase